MITATVTAYVCFNLLCHNALGRIPTMSTLACPRKYKLWTEFCINWKRYVCEDRVSLKYPERFDVFMWFWKDAYNKAIAFWKKRLKVIEIKNGK